MTESQLQRSVARLLDPSGLLWQHVPNEMSWLGMVRRILIFILGKTKGIAITARLGKQIGQYNQQNGVKAGAPDVLVFEPMIKMIDVPLMRSRGFSIQDLMEGNETVKESRLVCGLAIELKVGRNKPTASQREWHERLRARGWRVEVCRTIDEVVEVLRECYPNRFKA